MTYHTMNELTLAETAEEISDAISYWIKQIQLVNGEIVDADEYNAAMHELRILSKFNYQREFTNAYDDLEFIDFAKTATNKQLEAQTAE